ncbi:hypothetical protein, partial [Thermococcus sp.]
MNDLISYLHTKYASKRESPKEIDESDLRALGQTINIITLTHQGLSKRKTVEIEVHKGILDYENLLSTELQPLFSYPEVVYSNMSKIVSHDLLEAFRALLFDLPTASVMISLRAVEAAIRELYSELTNEEINESEPYPTWNFALSKIQDKVFEIDEAERSLLGWFMQLKKFICLLRKLIIQEKM